MTKRKTKRKPSKRKTAYCVIDRSPKGSLVFECGFRTKAHAERSARATKKSHPRHMVKVTKDVAR